MTSRLPLYGLLVATALSATGTAITLVVVPWFVLETTGSAVSAGVVAACELVPLTIASLVAGPAIERLGRRRAAVLSDLGSAAAFGAIPLVHATVGLEFWQLCALVAAGGLARAPAGTARRVLLPALADLAGTRLERASSAFGGVWQAGRLLGGPAGGVLIAWVGPTGGLVVTAAGFTLAAALIATLVPGSRSARTGAGYLRDLRDGLAYVRADRLVLALVAMAAVTNLLDLSFSAVLLPVYAIEVLGSSFGLGAVFGAMGVGALFGAAIFGAIGHRLAPRRTLGVAFVLMGAPRFGLLAATDDLRLVLAGVFLCGVAAGTIDPLIATVLVRRVPEELQARVFGVLTAAVLTVMPVGALLGGSLVEAVGLRPALLGGAACYLLVTLSPFVFRTWRALDRAPYGSLTP
ncbi:MAG TPA: MFS transporter [Pseudonocardiaceae bacterium]|nr:MFS transporter [Pseudonocardiaceae bacterium]